MGIFGSSSIATELASFAAAGIESTALLLQAQKTSLGFAVQTKVRAGENGVQGVIGPAKGKVGFKPIRDSEGKQSTA